MNVAIIPARGGSKRLPHKNLLDLDGNPLIWYSIQAALHSKLFDVIFVSTDCADIQAVANSYGNFAPVLRPSSFARDESPTSEAIHHAVKYLEKTYKQKCSSVAILQPTSPLREASHIVSAYDLMRDRTARTVVSVCKVEAPTHFSGHLTGSLELDGNIPREPLRRTQDYDQEYRLNGALYLIDTHQCMDFGDLYSAGAYAYVMDRFSSIDIDDKEDFEVARALLRYRSGRYV